MEPSAPVDHPLPVVLASPAATPTPLDRLAARGPVNGELVRHSLRLALATFLTAAISLRFERDQFLWYPLIAVVVTVDDSDDQTLKAAAQRLLGTSLGGLVTFAVHSVLTGWIGVLVALLLMLPLLRLLGWQAAIGTATLISLVFLMVPRYSPLNWDYVFNRSLDTAIGCLIAILVGLLFWPHNAMERLEQEELVLRSRLSQQLNRYRAWLAATADRPTPLHAAPFNTSLQQLERWVEQERHGPSQARLRRRRWPERLALWQGVRHHWLALERLLASVPEGLAVAAPAPGNPLWPLITDLEPSLVCPQPAGTGAGPSHGAPPLHAIDPAAVGWQEAPGAEAERFPPAEGLSALAPVGRSQELLEQARASGLPPLLLLAIASEQRAVARGLVELSRLRPC